MAGEGQQVLAMRALLRPIVERVLDDFGRTWLIRRTAALPADPEDPYGNAPGSNPDNSVITDLPIRAAVFQHDITRDSTKVGSLGSEIAIPAYELYCFYDQANLSVPDFVVVDPENKLIYNLASDPQEVGMVGLRVAWKVNLKAPLARSI